jgi:hypothetical protein
LTVADPMLILKKVHIVGLMGLVDGKEFDFLVDDKLALDDRVQKFLEYVESDMDEAPKSNSRNAFDDYMASWKTNRRRLGCDTKQVEKDAREMRREYDKAVSSNRRSYEHALDEIAGEFEPLPHKLRNSTRCNSR